MRVATWKLGSVCLILLVMSGCGTPDRNDPPPPEHLALIVFDTLRADRLSIQGGDSETAPFLSRISSELLRFDSAKSAAPWTVPSHASMFTGLWPAEHRAQWGRMRLRTEYETLAEILQADGFCTTGLSANLLVGPETGFDQGFDSFELIEGGWPKKTKKILGKLPEIFNRATASQCRLFLFLNLMDAHIPYNTSSYGSDFGVEGSGPVGNPKTKWQISAGKREFEADEKKHHIAAYDASARYLDDVSRKVIDLLRNHGLLDDTLIVFTSDHGEGLGSHQEIGHSISVWEEQLAVPLLIRFPDGNRAGEVVSEHRSTVQLTPSLLDWLGVGRPGPLGDRPSLDESPETGTSADYRSYFAEQNRDANRRMERRYPELAKRIHHSHVLYCDEYKLMVEATGRRQLYHLGDDPEEQNDLAAAGGQPLELCWDRYRQLLGLGRFTDFNEIVVEDDSEIDLETLRSLGYVQ